MIYRLIVLNGLMKGQRITIDPEPMTLGRDAQSDIVLPDNEVALKHARFEHRGSELYIHDLGSMNKVILNKKEVQDARLKHGDILELGRTRLLVEAVVQAEVQSSPGQSEPEKRRGKKHQLLAAAAVVLLAITGLAAFKFNHDSVTEIKPAITDIMIDPDPVMDADVLVMATSEAVMAESTVMETASVVATANEQPLLDDEIRQIREDLTYLSKHIEDLNKGTQIIAEARQTPESEPDVTSAIDLESKTDDVESVMKAARDAINSGDFSQADMLLEHLQLEHPEYLPSYEVRATLYENWGMPGKARDQWAAILQRTAESDLYRKAVAERIRLGRTESQRLISAHDAVRIQSIEQVRFNESSEYDEMRLVKIRLNYNRELGPIDPAGVHLYVYFFEQDMDTRKIELSKLQPFKESSLKELQNDALDQFTMSVSYVVPKGYYEQDHNTSRQRYYGFIARLHYFDRLVDEQARPPKLLEPAILEAAGLAVITADHRTSPESISIPASN